MSQTIELFKRGNSALHLNPISPNVDFHITLGGSDWLFAACGMFLAIGFTLTIITFFKPFHERLHYFTAIVPCFCMCIAYFTMGSNFGWTSTQALYNRNRVSTQDSHLGFRQVFYARYIGWFLSLPFVIIQASLMGHTNMWQIFFNVILGEIYVVCYLIGILVHSQYRWGYYTFGTAAAIMCCISIMTSTRHIIKRKGGELYKIFTCWFGFIMFIWGIYPLGWGLCEGGNVLVPDAEAIWYGILDVIMYGVMPGIFVAISGYFGLQRFGYEFVDEEALLPPPPIKKSPESSPDSSISKKFKKSKKSKK